MFAALFRLINLECRLQLPKSKLYDVNANLLTLTAQGPTLDVIIVDPNTVSANINQITAVDT